MTAGTGSSRFRWGATSLSVSFGKVPAVEDVSFGVTPGEVTAFVGGDGAGKTTVLRAMAGLVVPDAGEIRSPGRSRIGYVSAGPGVYRDLSTLENLTFVAAAHGLSAGERDHRIEELLNATGLSEARDRLGGQLSGGMRQKLAVAAALLPHPELLILDEPTTGVDPVSRAEVWRLIARAAAHGTGVLIATSYVDEAERASHVVLMAGGRALVAGTPAEIVAAIPGHLTAAAQRPDGLASWRRASRWRAWSPDGLAPGDEVPADLEDAAIIAELTLEGGDDAAA